MTKTATIRHEPAYFNAVAYANIPESWTIYPDDGSLKMPCEDMADARAVAARFGYTIRGGTA
jgi:hypothetical protein|tara:strand:- start:5845 stop:6030 length:186 start_codon:yes stop_codon:yes gene_type:complete